MVYSAIWGALDRDKVGEQLRSVADSVGQVFPSSVLGKPSTLIDQYQQPPTPSMSTRTPQVSNAPQGKSLTPREPTPQVSNAPQGKSLTPREPTPQVRPSEGIPGAASYRFDPDRVGTLPADAVGGVPSPTTQAPRSVRVPPGIQYTEEGVGRIPTFTMEPTQSIPDYMRETPEQAIRGYRDLQAAQASLRQAQYEDARRRAGDVIRPPGSPPSQLPIYEFQRAEDVMAGRRYAIPGNLASFSRLRNARDQRDLLYDRGLERLKQQGTMAERNVIESEQMRRLGVTGQQQADQDFRTDQRTALENRRAEEADMELERLKQRLEIGKLERAEELGQAGNQVRLDQEFADLQRRAELAQGPGVDLTQPADRSRFYLDTLNEAMQDEFVGSDTNRLAAYMARNVLAATQDKPTQDVMLRDVATIVGMSVDDLEELIGGG